MVKQTIQIFCRVKPTRSKTLGQYELDEDDSGQPRLTFHIPKDLADGLVNNKKDKYKFRFAKVFDQRAKQEDVFESVAKPVIDNVIQGYNGTIFAYGQTGSGKTFTITGGAERFADRGIIPRTLSYIFQYFEQNSENEYTAHVSYLEIYNDSGYDLLDPKHEASKLEDLPKVSLMEDADQNIHLKNLSTHQAGNEEDALNLLFLGDTNRMIAETPMNQASTRSHCIFTIHVSCRETGSATIRRAKLHLVDLAGSERIGKTGVNGQLLTEAKYINLSLHYLEQVIVALAEKSRSHIPYRNSMMTSVLRDSLGGNCMTTMIATCSIEKKNVDESISTCRFAQRVAMIKNDAILNEELDPKLMIAKLKNEIALLKEELAIATGEQRTDDLTDEEVDRCRRAVESFLEDPDLDTTLNIGGDMRKIQLCYKLLKLRVLERPEQPSQPAYVPEERTPPKEETTGPSSAEVKKLNDLLRQRDNEINILVNMLKKEKKRASDAVNQLHSLGHTTHRPASETEAVNGHVHAPPPRRSASDDTLDEPAARRPSSGRREKHRERRQQRELEHRERREQSVDPVEERNKTKILGQMSMGRNEAFEIFKRDYDFNQTIDEQKSQLKQRYAEAKSLGETVNQARGKINQIKAKIEQHRMSLAMQGLIDPNNPGPDETEQHLRDKIEVEKERYKSTFNRLRGMKTEIEHLQHLMEKSKVQLMKDFELWWTEQAERAESLMQHLPGKAPKSAWRTPPISPITKSNKHNGSGESPPPHQSRKKPPIPGHIRQSLAGAGTFIKESDPRQYGEDKVRGSVNQDSSRSRSGSSSSIPLTGDAQTDADIMAFLKARQNIVKLAQQSSKR